MLKDVLDEELSKVCMAPVRKADGIGQIVLVRHEQAKTSKTNGVYFTNQQGESLLRYPLASHGCPPQ